MNPNNLTQEQIKQGYSTIPGAYDPLTGKLKTSNVITPQSLQPQPQIQLPQTPQIVTPTTTVAQPNITETMLKTLESDKTEAQKVQETGISEILKSFSGLDGEAQALATEKDKAGVNILRQDLQGINSQILKKQAELKQDDIQLISNIRAEERRDTLLPFAQMGQAKLAGDAQIVRALKNAEIGVLNATAIAKQGDIALAQQTAEEAVAIKYEPYKDNIRKWEDTLKVIEPLLTRDEKKQAEVQKIKGQLAMREIEKAEAEEKSIQNMAVTLGANGVDSNTINQVLKAKTFEEAISIAGSKLQDPKLRFELEQLKLNNTLTREKIATEQRQRSLMGELTPAEKKAEALALKQAKTVAPVLQAKVDVLDGILNSNALGSTVGTSTLTRPSKNFIGKINPFGIPNLIGGVADKLTGERQLLIGSVNQLVSKEFLDSVLSLKAQGGTLGQITEREGAKLQQAATKIGTWEVKNKNDEVIGYNVSEKDFKDEITRIKEATNRILTEARGNALSEDEQAVIDSIYGNSLQADPSVYFNQ